jgi:hypothetical protein
MPEQNGPHFRLATEPGSPTSGIRSQRGDRCLKAQTRAPRAQVTELGERGKTEKASSRLKGREHVIRKVKSELETRCRN